MDMESKKLVRYPTLIYLLIVGCIFPLAGIYCVPNIRIQVNTNTLQNPPYVLDAIREAIQPSKSANSTRTVISDPSGDSKPNITAHHNISSEGVPAKIIKNTQSSVVVITPTATNQSSLPVVRHRLKSNATQNRTEYFAEYDNDTDSDGTIREDALVEALELELESVLKLSPENLINEVTKTENYGNPNYSKVDKKVGADPRMAHDFNLKAQKIERKPQLPVTNSHLKRPVLKITGEDDHLHVGYNDSVVQQSGARSRVSPTVSADEQADSKKPSLPDTLEPSQVMQGVNNKTLVPATIHKDYGHLSRTRITLGGGYVRDKESPSLDSIINERQTSSSTEAPAVPPVPVMPHLNLTELSRVIQMPERIVLPADLPVGMSSQKKKSVDRLALNNTSQLVQSQQLLVGEPDNRCPKKGVFTYEHPRACDKYYLCKDGYSTLQTCPNGLLYGTRDTVLDYCVHRWNVVCGEKTIPNPISSPGCRWQYGIFNVQGSPRCTPDYFECKAGVFEVKKCPLSGQVYDDRTKSCQYAEKNGCADEITENFQCPTEDHGNTYWPFPRYFLNERAIIQCINGEAQVLRCGDDQRVDPEHLNCILLGKSRID